MKKTLLEEVFKKALLEGASDNSNGLSTHISEALEDETIGFSLNPRTLRNYHQKLEEKVEDFNISKDILDSLAKYLDHENFQTFVATKNEKRTNTKRLYFVIIVLISILGFFVYDSTRKKCMIWKENQYVKIHCEEANAKPSDHSLLENFRKLEAECRRDFFFDAEGRPKVWYYKRGDKDLELFSSPGVHPIRPIDLRKINEDMIIKHICDTLI